MMQKKRKADILEIVLQNARGIFAGAVWERRRMRRRGLGEGQMLLGVGRLQPVVAAAAFVPGVPVEYEIVHTQIVRVDSWPVFHTMCRSHRKPTPPLANILHSTRCEQISGQTLIVVDSIGNGEPRLFVSYPTNSNLEKLLCHLPSSRTKEDSVLRA